MLAAPQMSPPSEKTMGMKRDRAGSDRDCACVRNSCTAPGRRSSITRGNRLPFTSAETRSQTSGDRRDHDGAADPDDAGRAVLQGEPEHGRDRHQQEREVTHDAVEHHGEHGIAAGDTVGPEARDQRDEGGHTAERHHGGDHLPFDVGHEGGPEGDAAAQAPDDRREGLRHERVHRQRGCEQRGQPPAASEAQLVEGLGEVRSLRPDEDEDHHGDEEAPHRITDLDASRGARPAVGAVRFGRWIVLGRHPIWPFRAGLVGVITPRRSAGTMDQHWSPVQPWQAGLSFRAGGRPTLGKPEAGGRCATPASAARDRRDSPGRLVPQPGLRCAAPTAGGALLVSS